MKNLILAVAVIFGLAGVAGAVNPIFGTVQISTSTTYTPTLQTGAFNTSSGTVQNLNSTNVNAQFLTVSSTASFVGVTGSTISYSSATFTNARITGVSGSTITYSSATFTSANIQAGTFAGTATGSFNGTSVTGTTGNFANAVNITGTLTTQSSTTVNGNFGITGNVTKPTTFTSSVTVSGAEILASTLSFTGTGIGIKGTTTNDSALTGVVGEWITGTVGNVNTPATGAYGDATSISLTAGDWDVSATLIFPRNTATWTRADCGWSVNSGNNSSGLGAGTYAVNIWASSSSTPNYLTCVTPPYRLSINATTTVYLKMMATFSAGQPQTDGGVITARRVR